MRFVPLIPSDFDPRPWTPFPAVEMAWHGGLDGGWRHAPLAVHAIHLPPQPWTPALGESAMAALRSGLEPDFLVFPAGAPEGRNATSIFLSVLEGLLEITHSRRVKVALRLDPGTGPAMTALLRQARGEAVGYCWDAQVGADLPLLSDRLFCAVGDPGDDFQGLQALGYRWNLAIPALDPASFLTHAETLEKRWPPVYFPSDLETRP